ncbi:pentapeptide repeat-containing protein [Piscirickettsia salmonis]|uniref:pentapeptide repeat-containing protein n=1 Tax=Piscirickettsia salmonis TaxID=1238 RepID=UPI00192EBAD6|nr:pentapeptide repeat-containing protein [Piscirickettsia salmonis]
MTKKTRADVQKAIQKSIETGDVINLYGWNLEGVDLRGLNLDGANLREANLHKANLEGVNLRGADLYHTKHRLVLELCLFLQL